jgi:hypothetical protein
VFLKLFSSIFNRRLLPYITPIRGKIRGNFYKHYIAGTNKPYIESMSQTALATVCDIILFSPFSKGLFDFREFARQARQKYPDPKLNGIGHTYPECPWLL